MRPGAGALTRHASLEHHTTGPGMGELRCRNPWLALIAAPCWAVSIHEVKKNIVLLSLGGVPDILSRFDKSRATRAPATYPRPGRTRPLVGPPGRRIGARPGPYRNR